jgi:hypothetical protein
VLGTTQLIAPALDSAGPLHATVRAVLMAGGVTLSFFTLEAGAHALLGDAVPELTSRAPGQLVLIGLVLAAFASVVLLQIVEPSRAPARWRQALALHLRNGLYANAAYDRLIGALRTAPAAAALAVPGAAAASSSPQPTAEHMESSWN